MWERVREIIRKEVLQALREPRMRVILFVPPMLQLIIFGYAVNLDVENGRVAWLDQDRTPASRELFESIDHSPYLEISAVLSREAQIQEVLDRGDVQAVVRIPPDFSGDIKRGRTATVQVLVEGTNSNTASILSNTLTRIISRFAAHLLVERQRVEMVGLSASPTAPIGPPVPSLAVKSRVWFNPDLQSRNYFVPGVIANIITLVTLMLTAMAIVREREIGTMEQLMVTPLRPLELMLGKTLPFALVGLVDLVLMTVAAIVIFDVPFRGSGLFLFLCSVVFLLTSLGIGLFISTISQTQQQAMMASFFFFLPAFMLSGFAFPIRNMPQWVQLLTYLDPVRYYIEIVRGVFLKGTGLAILWPQLASLLVFGVAILLISAARFRKRLD